MTPPGARQGRTGRALEYLAIALVALFAIAALVGPWVAPYDPLTIDLAAQYEGPSARHLLGAADNGVDLLSALLHGARLAGVIAFSVVGISVALGALLGGLAGYVGGVVDHVVSGAMDLLQAFPGIVLHIAILALVARPGVGHLILALSISGWVLYARLARAATLSVREQSYVEAARALGAGTPRVFFRHVLPNITGPLVVQATSGAGAVILAESTLSFLGLGPADSVSWGALLDQGSSVLLRFPHVALLSGATIALTVLAFHLAGDTLRDRLDPRSAN